VAESPGGPRGRSKLTLAERNSYENGIVFCTNHHNDIVDRFPEQYTILELSKWKKDHEKKYGNISSTTAKRANVISVYAGYIDKWAQLSWLYRWPALTAPMLQGPHAMALDAYHNYLELCSYLHTRVWPKKLPRLEDAFENFRYVASDLIFTFDKHADADGRGKILRTEKFYAGSYGPKYSAHRQSLVARFQFHTNLLDDLMLELTRAANLVCDRVRESVDAQFLVEEGRLIVESGMHEDSRFHRYVPQYTAHEVRSRLYPGLERFMKIREKRDLHFGRGVIKNYLQDD
jgi:hypothetical protein